MKLYRVEVKLPNGKSNVLCERVSLVRAIQDLNEYNHHNDTLKKQSNLCEKCTFSKIQYVSPERVSETLESINTVAADFCPLHDIQLMESAPDECLFDGQTAVRCICRNFYRIYPETHQDAIITFIDTD